MWAFATGCQPTSCVASHMHSLYKVMHTPQNHNQLGSLSKISNHTQQKSLISLSKISNQTLQTIAVHGSALTSLSTKHLRLTQPVSGIYVLYFLIVLSNSFVHDIDFTSLVNAHPDVSIKCAVCMIASVEFND